MKCGPERVLGENVVGALFDQLDLHPVVLGVFLEAVWLCGQLALVGQILGLQLPHVRFDLFEILGREGRLALEIVVEAGVGRRADAELGFGKQLQHRGGQQVRGGMPVDLERLGILRRSGSASVASLSSGRVRSYSWPLTLATTAASARRGLMFCAISRGLVPAGTVCDAAVRQSYMVMLHS